MMLLQKLWQQLPKTLVTDAIDAAVNGGDADVGGGGEEEDDEEYVEMDEKLSYLSPLLRLLTMTHLFISFLHSGGLLPT